MTSNIAKRGLPVAVLVVVIVALSLGLIYQQIEIENLNSTKKSPSPTPTGTQTPEPSQNPTSTLSPTQEPSFSPSSTPTLPVANLSSNITVTSIRNFNDSSYLEGDYLSINGTVTNDSPNTAYDAGLKVSAAAIVLAYPRTVIDVTVPTESGTYNTNTNYTLSTLTPYQSVTIKIIIYPDYQSQEPSLQGANVTLVWSNMP